MVERVNHDPEYRLRKELKQHLARQKEPQKTSREIEADSVNRVINLLGQYFPIANITQTVYEGKGDIVGIDLVLTPEQEFSVQIGMKQIIVQVKSSEEEIENLLTTFKKQKNRHANKSWETNLVLLNGQWPDAAIIADFTAQLINLMNFWGNDFEIKDFFESLSKIMLSKIKKSEIKQSDIDRSNFVKVCFEHVMAQGLIDQYRGKLLNLINEKRHFNKSEEMKEGIPVKLPQQEQVMVSRLLIRS